MVFNDLPRKSQDKRGQHGWQLGQHLGSRDEAHIQRWVAAQIEGRRNKPKCEAIAAGTGQRCRLLPLRGSTCCLRHSRGKQLDAAGRILAAEAIDFIENGGSPVQVYRAQRTLARIARRNLHQLWKSDPRIEGSTLALDDHTESKVTAWLNQRFIDLDKPLPNSTRLATPRCVDRIRWAAYRVIRRGNAASEDFLRRANRRIALAMQDDQIFWNKLAKLEPFDASQWD